MKKACKIFCSLKIVLNANINLQAGSFTSVGRRSVTSSCGRRRQMVGEDQKVEEDGAAEYLQEEEDGVVHRVRMKIETSGKSCV